MAGRTARARFGGVVRLDHAAGQTLLGRFDPQLLAGALYLGAGLASPAFIFTGARQPAAAEAPCAAPTALARGGGVFRRLSSGPLLLMTGLSATGAANASLLLNLEGLATMAIAWLVFRENADARLFAGAMAILAGAVVLSWQGRGLALDKGSLLVAGACLAWGIDNNLTRKLSSADPVSIAAIKGLAAGSVNVLAALARGAEPPGMAWSARRDWSGCSGSA